MSRVPLTHSNIIKLLGIELLPLDEKKEILMRATELIETRAFNRVMSELDDGAQKSFVEALNNDDNEVVASILRESNVDLISITEEEVEKLKQELSQNRFLV